MKYVRGFFAFWYDFIVGDAWEVAAGVVVALVLVYFGLRAASPSSGVYWAIALPLVIVALLAFSLWRVRNTR